MDTTAQHPATDDSTQSYADSYQPPTSSSNSAADSSQQSQDLERQNIFDMLGVSDGTSEQKEEFLDELQHVIWEDFIEHDVPLLITKEESEQLAGVRAKEFKTELEEQEAIVEFLEKLIPDMEDIMLEKALELKADLFAERLSAFRADYSNDPQKIAKIDEAQALMKKNHWASATQVLNSVDAE